MTISRSSSKWFASSQQKHDVRFEMKPLRIPQNWKKERLAKLVSKFEAGVSVNGRDRHATGDECGVLKISAVTEGKFRANENKVIDGMERERARLNPRQDRLIMSRANTPDLVGASAYIDRDYPNLYLSDKLWQFESRKEKPISMRWLGHVLASPAYRKKLGAMATGTSQSMKNISQESVLKLELLVPPLVEQQHIVQVLEAWDISIEKTERLIAAKEKRKAGLMAELLTGHRRVGEFKTAWRSWHLGELFEERIETNRGDLPLLSIAREEGVVPRGDMARKDSSNEDKTKYLRICPGDIGYNTMRMWQGVSALSRYDGIVSPAYTVCIPGSKIDGKFASYLFKLPEVINLFYRHSQGLTSDTWNLKFHHFAKIKVRIPEVVEQVAIARVLALVDEELAILQKQCKVLIQQKRGLMQKLLTGQWRVKVSEPEERQP